MAATLPRAKKITHNAELISRCMEMGKAAFHAGIMAVPAKDKNLIALLEENRYQPMGWAIEPMKAWSRGWHRANLDSVDF